MSDNNSIFDIESPIYRKTRLSPMEILLGVPIKKLDRVRIMSEDEFEDFIRQWVWGHLKTKYHKVKHFGGAGDKGRDVLGYYKDDTFDIYQCKHYATAIAPTQIYVELGKLCHYTFNNTYRIPKNYFIVSPHGPGPDLSDLILNPEKINAQLIAAWDNYCLKKISRTHVPLIGAFLTYVEKFDFSIVSDVDILDVIEEHSNTIYHAGTFGGGIKKYRDFIPAPSPTIELRELNYVTQLMQVYSEELGQSVPDIEVLKRISHDLFNHFNDQRKGFYCAESLEVFSRENFVNLDVSPFDEMKEDTYQILSNLLMLLRTEKGFQRLLRSIQEIHKANFDNNVLSHCHEIKALDRIGVCHHLANENKILWKP